MLVARKRSNITPRFQDQKIYMHKNPGGELERFRFAFVGFTSWDSFEDMVVKWTVSLTKIMQNPQRDKICFKRKEFKAFDVSDRLTEQRASDKKAGKDNDSWDRLEGLRETGLSRLHATPGHCNCIRHGGWGVSVCVHVLCMRVCVCMGV